MSEDYGMTLGDLIRALDGATSDKYLYAVIEDEDGEILDPYAVFVERRWEKRTVVTAVPETWSKDWLGKSATTDVWFLCNPMEEPTDGEKAVSKFDDGYETESTYTRTNERRVRICARQNDIVEDYR